MTVIIHVHVQKQFLIANYTCKSYGKQTHSHGEKMLPI